MDNEILRCSDRDQAILTIVTNMLDILLDLSNKDGYCRYCDSELSKNQNHKQDCKLVTIFNSISFLKEFVETQEMDTKEVIKMLGLKGLKGVQ